MKRTLLITIVLSATLFAQTPRYERSGDGIVGDRKTGLQWQDDYGDNGGSIKSAAWMEAIDYCENLTLGGFGDWRLPNIKELRSILDRSRSYPAVDPVFQNVTSNGYWSSTTYAGGTSGAWVVNFRDGYSAFGDKTGDYDVRCVRGGQ